MPPRGKSTDAYDRFWEASVSRIGPAVPSKAGSKLDRWKSGNGQLRIACYVSDHIRCMAMCRQTLCMGTETGLVRTVDVTSGAVVGEYQRGSHLPLAPITTLHFDDAAVVAGDAHGNINAWTAKLPGSWGVASQPQKILIQDGGRKAHSGAVTGMVVLKNACLASASEDGTVVFWSRLSRAEKLISEIRRVPMLLDTPVTALCAAPDSTSSTGVQAVFAAVKNGTICRVQENGKSSIFVKSSRADISCMALVPSNDTLLVAFVDGSINILNSETGEITITFDAFHRGAVKDLHVIRPIPAADNAAPRFITTGADGRVCVWSAEGKPLWGLRGLSSQQLAACSNSDGIFASGLVLNPSHPGNAVLNRSWKEDRDAYSRGSEIAPACEGVVSMDFSTPEGVAATGC